jgi:uncharacterized membrane protein
MITFSFTTGWLKFVLGWIVVFLIRLIPFRPANFEPMLATVMPFSKRFGLVGSFLFGFLGILLFDVVTSGIGMWTWITACAYGTLGIWAHYFFKKREATTKNFVVFGVMGTLAYDIVTGLSIGPLFYGQPFMQALVGQIPFTAMHLVGAVVFSVALSPALYRWVLQNETFELSVLWSRLQQLRN